MTWPRLSRGDFAIGIAVVLLAWALAAPTLRDRSFRALVATAVADVEVVERAARTVRGSSGRWPEAAGVGTMPTELAGSVPLESGFGRGDFTLEWSSLEIVDYVEVEVPPPADPVPGDAPAASVAPELRPVIRTVGLLRVHSDDDALHAELLRRFGPERSYVGESSWTLIVEESGAP